jgi:hypothetical protein
VRVGPIGAGWSVRCAALGDDRSAWDAGAAVPIVRVGAADEASSRFFRFTLVERVHGTNVLEIRVATIGRVDHPALFEDGGRLFVLADGWVAEVDLAAKALKWEQLIDVAVVDAWLLGDGRLLVIGEIEVVALDERGRAAWRVPLRGIVAEYGRVPPLLRVVDDEGPEIVIDETTGQVVAGG